MILWGGGRSRAHRVHGPRPLFAPRRIYLGDRLGEPEPHGQNRRPPRSEYPISNRPNKLPGTHPLNSEGRRPLGCASHLLGLRGGHGRDLLPTAGPQGKRPQHVAAASPALVHVCGLFVALPGVTGSTGVHLVVGLGAPQRGLGGGPCRWPRPGLRSPRPAEEELRTLAGWRSHVQPAIRPGLGQVGEVPLSRRYHCLCHLARPAQLVQEALHPLSFVRWHSNH